MKKVHFLYADGSIGQTAPIANEYRTKFEMKVGDRLFLVYRDTKGAYVTSFKEIIETGKANTKFNDKSGKVKANYNNWIIKTRTIIDSPNKIYIASYAKEFGIPKNGYTAFCYDNNTALSLRHSKPNYEKMYRVAERILMLLCR